jgi:selenocysteine-specific elongation factor
VQHGLVALTKADLVDDDALALARLEIEDRLPWPVVAVDSLSGRGLDDVGTALDEVIAAAPAPRDTGRPRLWVDRVFAARGSGTVVTGTLTGGSFARDDEVVVEPGGHRARVRRIESHHEQLDAIGPGNRVALNLAGIDRTEIARGAAVVRPGQWALVDTVDVELRPVPGHTFPKRSAVAAHVGSGEQPARLRLLDGSYARLRLTTALPLAPGDRVVLRSSGAQTTVGGAIVLDVAPARRVADAVARLARPLGERVLAARPWCTPNEYERLAGEPSGAVGERIGAWIVLPSEVARVRACAADLARDGWPSINTVAAGCGVEVAQLRAALGDDAPFATPLDDPAAHALLDALDATPFAPPTPDASPALVRALVQAGALVDLDGVIFTTSALDQARALIAKAVVERGSLSVADIRDLLGSSRKYVLPIVNRMDAEGITRRRDDLRIPGPRAEPPFVQRPAL